ncbi:sensor histidine kinase [Paenibacillus piri]|uniref:sensor histidine kinase n=1 Tax=Paenibacillus piri TaxID=2547395 RepID=UPI001404A884|nr:histidine kinase [Paenibacillus piri]
MSRQVSIFTKIFVMVLLLLIPILILYTYSNQVSMGVVRDEIEKSSLNRLSFFLSQVDSAVNQFSKLSYTLGKEPEAVKFQTVHQSYDLFDSIKLRQTLSEKIKLQSLSNSWINEITIFSPSMEQFITSNPAAKYNLNYFQQYYSPMWGYQKKVTDFGPEYFFIRHSAEPSILFNDIAHANMIIEVAFAARNIQIMLDQFKNGGNEEPFFYHPDYEPIVTSGTDKELVGQLISRLDMKELSGTGSRTIELRNQQYVVNYAESDTLHWMLIDFLPLEEVLNPITTSRNLFYTCFTLFLVTGILSAYLLYRNVQVPVRELLKAVYQLKRGNFSARLAKRTNSEFTILFSHFNSMAAQIQELIEKVFVESIRVRDATLKQLQSQINPHFLYNCLAFIQSMAQLENKEAIIAMTQHLSKYYRYTTRLEVEQTSLRNELDVVVNYLNIHKLQLWRLDYEVIVPEAMMELEIPKLILQPIVENAIVHGIEQKLGAGLIRIEGELTDEAAILIVDDNGAGSSEQLTAQLNEDMNQPMNERKGFGVWNVHQRLIQRFGAKSGLVFSSSPLGGLRVTIKMDKHQIERGNTAYVSSVDR